MAIVEDTAGAPVKRRAIWGWMLFDWASQPFHTLLITFIFARYFTTQVAPDPVSAQESWSLMLTVSGLAIALSAPVLGAIADATGPRKPWIAVFSAMAIVGAAYLWTAQAGVPDNVLIILIAFGIMLFGIEFAAVFNNAVMPDLVPREQLGRLSGNGWALGYLGGTVSLFIVLLLMVEDTPGSGKTLIGMAPIFGLDTVERGGERATGPLTALWYLVFVLPFFLFTPDTPRRKPVQGAVKKGLSELFNTIKNLPKTPSLFAYLGSSMFYRDALNGLFTFGGLYAGGVLQWEALQLGLFGILAAITGAIGALIGGRFDDKRGPKTVIRISIITLIIVCCLIVTTDRTTFLLMPIEDTGGAFTPPDILFYVCGALIGAAGGSLQAASRTLMADQAEDGNMTEAFGLYALSGKATTFLAPFLIFIATAATDSQRLGIVPLIFLFAIGLFLLSYVREQKIEAVQRAG